jgi:hypothetical protein
MTGAAQWAIFVARVDVYARDNGWDVCVKIRGFSASPDLTGRWWRCHHSCDMKARLFFEFREPAAPTCCCHARTARAI